MAQLNKGKFIFLIIIFDLFVLFQTAGGQCTWPSAFVSSTWVDNVHGNLVFDTTTMSGWSFSITTSGVGQNINDWQCVLSDQFDTDGYLVMRSVNNFAFFVTSQYYAYLCLKMRRVTDVSFRYYVFEPEQANINFERYLVSTNGGLSTIGTTCYESFGASGSEYKVMVKSGFESQAQVLCPWVFMGRFDYYHTVNGVSTCTSGGNDLDVCTNKEIVGIDFTTCSTDVAYSGQTSVSCLDNVPVGTDTFVTVYNAGTVDNVNTFPFSCFGVAENLTTVSIAPGYCRKSQSTNTAPSGGALVTLTSITELCRTCEALSNPDGGNVTIQTDGSDTIAIYMCAEEYDMYGDASRTCQTDTTWTGSSPVCKCKYPSSPVNGNVTVSSDGLLATYICDPGYVLTGNQYRSCQANGNAWNGTEPTCDTCDPLTNINNGLTELTSEGITTIASFSCDIAYSLSGSKLTACQADGTWNDTLPSCVACSSLVAPALGGIHMTTDGSQTTASFFCDSGYQISGLISVTCQTDGQWNGTEPSCVCETLSSPVSGFVSVSSDGMTASYTCDTGYSLSGESTRQCLLNGSSWTHTPPSCELCSNLTDLTGGSISYTTNGVQTEATFTCLSGYTLNGDQTTTCTSDGNWSQTTSSCVACPTLTNQSVGSLSVSTNGLVSIATYSCSFGYDLIGDTSRTCQANGTWTNTAPTCACTTPTTPTNGAINITGDVAQYSCNIGYTLNGANLRMCVYDGSGWNSSDPTCAVCDSQSTPSDGNYTLGLSDGGLYTYAVFGCNVGYTMVGAATLACQSDGTWNGTTPACINCDSLLSPANGSVSFTTDGQTTAATVSCDQGTSISDSTVITFQCNTDGTWNATPFTCVTCESLEDVNSGNISFSTNGSSTLVAYTCPSGYNINGNPSRVCLNNGSWTGSDPTCVCEDPGTITNGLLAVSSDGMSAVYTCDLGYSLLGTPNLNCQNNGSRWDTNPPSCVKCDDLVNPLNGNVTIDTNGTSSVASYLCETGYTLSGTSTQICQSDGTWTLTPPACVLCDSLTSPSVGSFSLTYNGTNTQATFTCDSGYNIHGGSPSMLTCQTDGTWDTAEPNCVCDIPNAPANGDVAVSSDGLTATYSCDIRYSLNGTGSRLCLLDGSSWSDTGPICVTCDTLQDVQGGNISYTTDGLTTVATFTCDVGSTLSGVNTRTCGTDATWNDSQPTCAECPSLGTLLSGQISINTDSTTTTAMFSCNTGYYLNGNTLTECLTNGQWSNTVPTCVCDAPASPSNGELVLSNSNLTATYTCDAGYVLSGSSVRSCGTDGSGWTGDQPACLTCESTSSPSNGSVNVTSDGTVTQAVFSCLVGSSLIGNPVLTCTQNGTWDLAAPTCVTCSGLTDPASGVTTITTNGTLSLAEFTCSTGYSIIGDTSVLCQTDGTWTGNVPLCVCDPPISPTDGSMVVSTDGMEVLYTCDVGTSLSGSLVRSCQSDGSGWSDTDPLCVSCPMVATPTNGAYSMSTNGSLTAASFNCTSGYSLSGSTSVTCLSSGFWSDNSPTCVQCSSLTTPDSGSVVISSDGIGSTASFTCVTGYQIAGNSILTCISNGTWDSGQPSCICTPPSSPTNGNMEISVDLTTATYTCNTGYTLQGQHTRTCQTNGAGWTDTQPTCNQCDSLSNQLGGSISMETTGTVTQAVFSCVAGYTLNGGATLTCRDDGTWDVSAPSCTSCTTLSTPANGLVSLSTDGVTTVANFTCSVDYTLSGNSLLTCKADGNWDFTSPSCVKCQTLSTVSAGSVLTMTDGATTTAAITCVTGYYISGQSTITCQSDASWSDDLPSCVCTVPSSPGNGSLTISMDGMTVTYTCDIGYTLVGDQVTTCDQNGAEWSSLTPSCVYCQDLDSQNNATTSSISNGTTTIVSYTCGLGSTITGQSTISCQDTGNWTSEEPSCVKCPMIVSPTDGAHTTVTNGTMTTASFTCTVGYSLAGSDTLTCQSNGTWNRLEPLCTKCEDLTTVNSGSYSLATNNLVTTATFTCVTGYYVDGSSQITCLTDGTWDNSQPSCVCDTPSSPSNGGLWVSSDGMTVTYSCDLGYSLQGETSNTCNTDGTGWLYSQPSCSQCQSLVSQPNGNITLYTNGTFTKALYTCDDGYTLSSDTDISVCTDTGVWNLTSLSCVQCDDLEPPSSGSVNVESKGSYTRATYSCITGYNLEGVTHRSCLTNGTWDLSAPTCVCQSPSVPSNGGIVLSADQQTVNYSCDVGYSLNGVTSRQCATDGTSWSDIDPQCVTCSTLSTVSGGSIAMTTDGQATTANISCHAGFSLSGTQLLTCRSDGTWDFSVPTCVTCDSLNTSASGSQTISTDGFISSVTFECDNGFVLTGTQQATCSSSGSWSSTEPDCVECLSLTNPNSGAINTTTNGTVSMAVTTCSPGYIVEGQSTLTCQSDGTWDNQQPTCVCDPPSFPVNGNMTLTDGGYTALFTCESGYSLHGDSLITCSQAGSRWNGSTPSCVQCNNVTAPGNGSVSIFTDGITTMVTISCDVGFTASASINLTCQVDGTFNVNTPDCVKCSDLQSVSNGNQQLSSTGSETIATFTCDLSYSLQGETSSSCTIDGSWTSAIPSCVQCDTFPTITSSSHTFTTNGTLTTSAVVCTHGYTIIGSVSVTCGSNGTWDTSPSCICEDPAIPSNGNLTSNGQEAVFTCNLGYSLNGSQFSYCNTDGSGWNSSVPVCVGCGSTSTPSVGQGDMISDGSNTYILYTCPVGYSLTGNQTITCVETGSWSAVEPSCTTCESLTVPVNGNISMTTDNATTSAVYSCLNGYYLEGISPRYCLEDGTWSDSAPECYCVTPGSPLNGNVEISGDRASATYTCDVGFSVDGVLSRVCQNDSTGWSNTQPSCSLCSTLTTPSGGQFSASTDGSTTTATFTCGSGYTLGGSQYLGCRSDGSWNTSEPTCVTCDTLTYPSGGSYTISTDGGTSVVHYTCDSGYTLSGGNNIQCSTTGQWVGQSPTCVSCPVLTAPDSGSMVLVTDDFTTTAVFSCAQGYYISNAANPTCSSSGQWDASEPECFCDPPINITNGNFMVSMNQSEVTYICDTGYTLNGSVSRICQGNGQGWSESDPTCVQCAVISTPSGGGISTSSNGSTTITTFTCDTGSTISGDITLECGTDGTWTSVVPSCVECSSPSLPANGNYTLSSNGTHTVVDYSCSVGYSLDGESSASCETSSIWTSITPDCVLCSSLGIVTNGDIVLSTNRTLTIATFTCVTNYYLMGSISLECRTDGSWTETEPSCVCDQPLSIVNGNFTVSTDGMTVEYMCDLGYSMSGSSARSCGVDGSGWSGSPPTCTSCDSLTSIGNGNIVFTTDGTYTTVVFDCDTGYSVDSSDYQATCNNDGTWNVTVPACVECPSLPAIQNGNVTVTSNGPESVGSYYCLPDYTLTGDQTRLCQQGTWNGTEPTCLCTYSTYLEDGNAMSDGINITYTCDSGYVLDGTTTRTCQNDGTGWSLSEPVCVLCDSLTTPSASNMTFSTDGIETSAHFTCMNGYTLTGSSQLTCRSDGTWNSVEPSCGVPCTSLTVPQGGNVTMVTDGLTTIAQYVCDTGYSLVGSSTLTCRSDGSWDLTESTCVQCQTLTVPVNGYVTTSSDGSTTEASYTCHHDYYLDGTNTTTCHTDGTWDGPQPTCYCQEPTIPVNGSVTLSIDKGTATFTCTEGFTLEGNSTITCQNDYTGWSGNTPVCVYCGGVFTVENGTSSVITDGTVTSVINTCDVGSTLSGSQNVSCTDNGTWLEQFPTCESCQPLQSLVNGSTALTTDGLQTSAQFTCDIGYTMLGETLIYCSVDGSWNNSVPTCVQCEIINTPASGSSIETTDGITSHMTFTCVSGYHIEGHSKVSCLSDGSWNGSTPLCVCDLPSSPTNGEVVTGSNTSVIQYTCDSGYSIYGQSQRLCSEQGTGWLDSAPTCVQCESVHVSSNLSTTLTSNGQVSQVVFECNIGYTLDGSSQLQCLENGTWSGNIPTCVECEVLTEPDSGIVNVVSNGSVSSTMFACLSGYHIQGMATLYCNTSGVWDSPTPTCLCDTPPSPVNGDISADGVIALYTCDTGYTLYGDNSRSCQQAGLGWNGSQPNCTACSSLDAVAGGSVTMTTDGIITTAHYSCDVGYTMFGTNTLTCRSDGTWDYTNTLCITCETLSIPDNGIINQTTNSVITTALFTCDTGYTLKGTSLLTCRTDGTWDLSEPSCVKCSDLTDPSSGTVSVTSTGKTSSAVYTCLFGYYISGDDIIRICGTDGLWNGTAPSCVCDPPVTPANSNMTLSDGNMTAEFTCEVGYTLSGSSVLVCQTDGSGWNASQPSCNQCESFINIANSSTQFITDGQSSVVIVTCNTGTTLIGQSEIECQTDGTWNISSTLTCASCPDLTSPIGGYVNISSNGSVSVAAYRCDTNYSLSGSPLLQCLNTGLWDNTSPTCVQCASIKSPASGSVVFTSDGYSTMVTYSCINGYEVYGNSVMSCLDDGLWNSTTPYCVCESPPVPANGSVSTTVDGLQVTYSCDVGYSIAGSDLSYCDIGGSGWNTSTPTCVQCSTLNGISNGNWTLLTNQTSTYASYTCDLGYTLSDDVIRTCLDDGSWTFTDPICVSCEALSNPSSGIVTITTDGTVSSAGYACATGYDLQGWNTRTCQTDGQWNSSAPICTCQLPISPDNGNVTFGSDATIAQYTCDVGYTLNGTSQRNCQTDGSWWDSVSPNCVVCETLQSIAGATMATNTDGTTTTTVYTCNTGYTLVGESSLTCRNDGTWNVQAPTCVTCATLNVADGGSVAMSSNNSVTLATFTCSPGYTQLGSTILSCRSTGTWDFNEPDCVLCPALDSPSSGNVSMSTDGQTTTAMFTCSDEYYLDGTNILICQTSGSWNDISPLCKCSPPVSITNGNYTISDNGSVLTHTCDSAYSMKGNALQLCDSSRNGWTGQPPNCSLCESLTSQINGTLSVTTDGMSTVVTFTCQTGYSLSGQSVVECQSDGTWNFLEQPSCEQCTEIAAPINGFVNSTTNGTTTYISVTCDLGYTLNGTAELMCLDNGSMSDPTPSCVECPTLSDIDNGNVLLSSNGTVMVATYSCSNGYSILGDTELFCSAIGSWSNTPPTCSCDTFTSPSNGAIAISDNGTVATYTCGAGYTLSGDTTLSCESTLTSNGGNFTSPTCTTCDTFSTPAGSIVSTSTDGQTTSAIVTCDVGYTLVGSTHLTCRSDGTWDIQTPSCAVCDSVNIPADGNVTFNSDGSETVATFLCNLGYTMVGTNTLTCRSDGTWNFDAPTCVVCPALIAPSSGQLSLRTDGSVTEATITCANDYFINGDSVLTCETDGQWSSLMPTCVCNPPTSLLNGNLSLSSDDLNVTFTCSHGYTLSGVSLQTCLSDGSGWSGSLPNCSKCSDLQILSNGTITMTTDGQVTKATFACSLGYTINGSTELTCNENGTWDFSEPSCGSCIIQSAPTNGNIEYLTNGSITYVQYSCDTGYTLSGSSSAYCLSDGMWDNTQPTCVECSSLVDPDNGEITVTSNGSVSLATLSCKSGYSVIGEVTVTCTTDGQWSHTAPLCLCDEFADPLNGNLVTTNNGTKALYTCEAGYSLNGEAEVECGTTSQNYTSPSCSTCESLTTPTGASFTMTTDNTTTFATVTCDTGYTIVGEGSLTCRSDGTWDISLPSCVTCNQLTQPDHSSVNITSQDSVTIATVTCDIGYSLSGASTLTCRADGTWDYTMPTCVGCPILTKPPAGSISMTTDGTTSMITYTCVQGYYYNGSLTSECSTSGNWSSEAPICICTPPISPTKGSYSLTAGGFTAIYSCDSGYTLNGSVTLSCDTEGSEWNDSAPTCSECEAISPSTNSSITITSNGTSTTAEFTCDTGYSISGFVSLVCDETGTWSGSVPSCTLCPVLTTPLNGSYTVQSNGTTTSVLFQCEEGSSLSGSSESECNSDGVWSSGEPSCVECPSLVDPDNGEIIMTSNGSVSLATLSCKSGYSVRGEVTVTCTTDGQWSHTAPSCLCDEFSDPLNGNLVTTNNGTKALYTCEAGYSLNGESEVECGTTSLSYTPPTCTTCESLTTPTGASVTMTTDNTTTFAMVTCDKGYTIVGAGSLTCRSDGTWDISLPSCVTCNQLTQRDHSTVNITSQDSVTIATVTCDVGYSLSGASSLTCRADGTWDYTMPTCVACPTLTSPPAGSVSLTTDGITSMVMYTCVQGYYYNGSLTSECSTLGNWSSEAPICICSTPVSPTRGSYSLTAGGFTAIYSCDSGYTLNGSVTLTCDTEGSGWTDSAPTCSECEAISPSTNSSITITSNGTSTSAEFTCDTEYSISGFVSLVCDETGTWSGSVPSCTLCPVLTTPVNGSYIVESNGTTTSVLFQCEEGSSLSGSSESECNSDGVWSSGEPSCLSCVGLEAPYNGAVETSSNGSITKATYSCISGYSVVGETVLSCLTTGQWSHTPPICFCDDFTQLINGNIQLTDNGTKAAYSCATGYTLNGQQELTCGTATATYVMPTCSTCDSLAVPTGASVTMGTDNTTTSAMVKCDTGYTLIGEGSLTCRSDGTWDINTPSCVSCEALNYPEGSTVNITSVDSVTVAHVSCSVGYTLNGASSLTCKSDGSWDFQLPSCVQCPGLADPVAGNVSLTTDGVTSSALYTCTNGYYADGISIATCNSSGSWSSLPPTCKCVTPTDVTNGSYVLSDEGFTVTYSCDVGYTMSGTALRTCDTEGSGWSGQPPLCVFCEEILTDSSVTLSLNGTTSTAEFTCDEGYSIAGSFNLICNENGTWSGNFPTCQQCTALSSPDNGSITIQSNGTSSSVAFTCTVGTTLVGESEAVCTDSGVWSFQEPLCVSCATLSSPLNGVVTMETNGSVTLATFTCDSGYQLAGDDTLMCKSDGAWNSSSPLCECEIFGGIENGNINISDDGTTAMYTCPGGYTLSGVTELSCSVNTSTLTLPSCVTCDSLQTTSGLSVTSSTDGATTTAFISCDTGYTISGDNVMSCRTDGTWNISTPSCVVCETLSTLNGVNITMTSDGKVTKALFTCPYGFTLNGTSELECRTDGTWNFESPSCDCNQPTSLVNGEVVISNDGFTTTYTCDLGYSLNGLTSRSCSVDGSWWSGSNPNCTECSFITLSEGLNSTLYTDGSSTMAYFQCGQGYTISHRRNLTCLQDGSWDDTVPICVTCPILNISTGLTYQTVSDGLISSVSFTCGDGYTMTGAVTVTCLDNRTWDSTLPSCTAVPVSIQSDCANQVNGAAIGLGVAFAIAAILAIILAVIAWHYRKLYKGLGGSKASYYSADQPNWVLQDSERHAPSRAPVSHLHHVMDVKGMSRASSQAPTSFSNHDLESDYITTPSPALMTSRKLGGAKMPRSVTSSTFQTESTNLSRFMRNKDFDSYHGSSPRKMSISEQFTDIPTIRLDDDSSSFMPITKNEDAHKTTSRTSDLSEQTSKSLSPSSILVSQGIIRGDSPLPQQILTPRNDEEIKQEQSTKSTKRQRQHGKKSSSSRTEGSFFSDKRSLSTLYNETISSKLKKKRSTDFVDTGTKGLEVPKSRPLRTPSPSFNEVDVTDIENDVSDIEV